MNKLITLFSLLYVMLLQSPSLYATVYTVNSTSDVGTGAGTTGDLRYCITAVNATAAGAPHTIRFSIPGVAPYIIDLSSDLPAISRAGTILDATTQAGFSPAYIPVVYLTNSSGGTNGIYVDNVPNVEIYGLQVYNFDNGIYIFGDAADGFKIGGVNKKNVINRCNYHHVFIESADNGLIKSNNIGCDLTGAFGYIPSQVYYSPDGLYFLSGADNNTIGGAGAAEGNLIAGSAGSAVHIGEYGTTDPSTGSSGNVFYGNTIGGSGTNMAWYCWAFWIDGNSDNNIIGGVLSGEGNNMSYATTGYCSNSNGNLVIAINEKFATGNQVRGNNMACAFGYGIVLAGNTGDEGNNNIQAPVITGQSGNIINGTAPANATVDLYTGSLCNDVYGKCKGETYITTVTADASGNWSADLTAFSLSCSTDITAIASTILDGSSPFADCFSFCGITQVSSFCDSVNGNIAIFSNYDGGILTINVDKNIPNLKIGICTYEPIQVTITGPYVGNVTQVEYAGFNSNQNNNNCSLGNFPTTISGVPANIVTINPPMTPPQVGYSPVHGNGYPDMVGVGGDCDTTINAGGGNTPDEVVYYFLNAFSGTLLFHLTQYNCWMHSTLNISDGGNCCIMPASAITILPPKAFFQSDDSSFCSGGCIDFTDNSINSPAGWLWTFTGAIPSSSTVQNPKHICYVGSGTYDVKLMVANGGGSDSLTLTNLIRVNPEPPTPSITQSNDTLYCSTDSSYISYQWYDNTTLLPNDTNVYYVASHNGNYNVKVINKDSCIVGVGITVTVGLSTPHGAESLFSVKPNPASSQINFLNEYIPSNEPVGISIVNVLGERVREERLNWKNGTAVNIANMPVGVYFIRITAKHTQWQGKFIKE